MAVVAEVPTFNVDVHLTLTPHEAAALRTLVALTNNLTDGNRAGGVYQELYDTLTRFESSLLGRLMYDCVFPSGQLRDLRDGSQTALTAATHTHNLERLWPPPPRGS